MSSRLANIPEMEPFSPEVEPNAPAMEPPILPASVPENLATKPNSCSQRIWIISGLMSVGVVFLAILICCGAFNPSADNEIQSTTAQSLKEKDASCDETSCEPGDPKFRPTDASEKNQ